MGKAKILVSSNLKENSELSIATGIELAKKLNCDVNVFHIHKGENTESIATIFPEFEQKSQELSKMMMDVFKNKLKDQVDKFRDENVDTQTNIFVSTNFSKYSDVIKGSNAKLLVVPTAMSEFDSFIGGSTVEKLIRTANIPVLVTKNNSLVSKCKKIVFPFAFQGLSEDSLDFCEIIAEAFHSKIYPVHVYDESKITDENMILEQSLLDSENECRIAMKKRLEILISKKVVNEIKFIQSNNRPKEKLLNFIKNEKPDLVIMGSSGKKGLERLYLGSFCEYLLRNSDVSLLITKKF